MLCLFIFDYLFCGERCNAVFMRNRFFSLVSIGCVFLGYLAVANAADEKPVPAPVRIGVYDSRAVAYAHFWSEPYQKTLRERMIAAKAAKEAGDTVKYKEYETVVRAEQEQNHRQVFSVAPATEAIAAIKGRLPEIQKEAGVTAIVSKWDENALREYKSAEKVDLTDRLVREFIQPTEKQLKTISSIQKSKPLSLEKCDELIRKGEI
jgi:hypothetical protein